MRIAMKSPQTPDCRGGVFAVFAKIPPPICPPHARILSDASLPRGDGPHGHVGAGGLCSDVARRVAIRHRVVVKTIGFHRLEARRPDNDAARRVATSSEERENWF